MAKGARAAPRTYQFLKGDGTVKLEKKRALITGGTRGIGAAIAVDLAAGGAAVAVNGRQMDDEARALCERITAAGKRCVPIQADMARPEEIERCVDQAVEQLGGLDVLIHSAGGPAPGTIEQVSPEQWHEAFAVHVHAAYHLCRHGLPYLRQNREAAIVLISSVAGLRGCPGAIAYGTVKGAIVQFTRMLARDLADENIRVNAVAPGIVRTRFHDGMPPETKEHNLRHRIPLHREGAPQDIAQAVHLLVTNDFMTGETITVDGGMTMQIVR